MQIYLDVESLLNQLIDVEDAEKAFFTLLPINQRQSNCLDWKGRKRESRRQA